MIENVSNLNSTINEILKSMGYEQPEWVPVIHNGVYPTNAPLEFDENFITQMFIVPIILATLGMILLIFYQILLCYRFGFAPNCLRLSSNDFEVQGQLYEKHFFKSGCSFRN